MVFYVISICPTADTAFVRDGALRTKWVASRGRKHLVDYERSEIIYLVICDHYQID